MRAAMPRKASAHQFPVTRPRPRPLSGIASLAPIAPIVHPTQLKSSIRAFHAESAHAHDLLAIVVAHDLDRANESVVIFDRPYFFGRNRPHIAGLELDFDRPRPGIV